MEDLIKDPETTVIDVREINEFESGHFEGAINIPLGSIPMRIAELKAMNGPLSFIAEAVIVLEWR